MVSKLKKKPGDFKRPKRKVGRKVASAANVTSVSFKSKRINLLEQSVCREKGEAVTSRNLNLSDLVGKMVHYNAHVRKDALMGLKELAGAHPHNLQSNLSVVLQHLLQALMDGEGIVREACLTTWSSFLGTCQQRESLIPFVEIITVYFCSGLTNIRSEIREDVLKAINSFVDLFPDLLASEGNSHYPKLIENFKDVLGVKQAQSMKVKNSYSALSSVSGKTNKTAKEGSTPISSFLRFRFSALKTLLKLLQKNGTNSVKTTALTNNDRCNFNLTVKSVLIYTSPMNLCGPANISTQNVEKKPSSSKFLLVPLFDMWIESTASDLDNISVDILSHLVLIVRASSLVLSQLSLNSDQPKDTVKTVQKIYSAYMSSFPYYPSSFLCQSGNFEAWMELNIALCNFACVQLELGIINLNPEEVSSLILEFVEVKIQEFISNPSVRQLPCASSIVESLLLVMRKLIPFLSKDKISNFMKIFNEFFKTCNLKSATSRVCSTFAADIVLSHRKYWIDWDIICEWLGIFGRSIAQCDTFSFLEHLSNIIAAMICILKFIPQSYHDKKIIKDLESSLVEFFLPLQTSSNSSSKFCLSDFNKEFQLEAISLIFYLPNFSKRLLQTLAACCKLSTVNFESRSFLLEVISHRKSDIVLSHYISFLLSILFSSAKAISDLKDASFLDRCKLNNDVCKMLGGLNLGSQLVKSIAPTIIQSMKMDKFVEFDKIHGLIVCSLTCLKESTNIELPLKIQSAFADFYAFTLQECQTEEMRIIYASNVILCLESHSELVVIVLEKLLERANEESLTSSENSLFGVEAVLEATSLHWIIQQNFTRISDIVQKAELRKNQTSKIIDTRFRQIHSVLSLINGKVN